MPTAALLCQGQLAPDFAGWSWLTERLPWELEPGRPATLQVGAVFDDLHVAA
jgi:hypothetical protein